MSDPKGRCPDRCGCCEPPAPATPIRIFNRPSLSNLEYRVGTYPSFRQAMIQAVSEVGRDVVKDLPANITPPKDLPLSRWTARDQSDYGIALIEMWATLGDVLTFYQERIANEAFLRTAVYRDSIQRLASLLDYSLSPGIASSTYLAFTMDDDAEVDLSTGLRAQSVPKEGQKPQIFETVETVEAKSDLNKVRIYPEPKVDDPLNDINNPSRVSGTLHEDSLIPQEGDRLVLFKVGDTDIEEKTVDIVETTDEGTILHWSPPINTALSNRKARTFTRIYRPFGYNAPPTYLDLQPGKNSSLLVWKKIDASAKGSPYSFELPATRKLPLDGLYDDIEVGAKILITGPSGSVRRKVDDVEQKDVVHGPMSETVTVLTLNGKINPDDRRVVRIYLLSDNEIRFRGWDWDDEDRTIKKGMSKVYVSLEDLDEIEDDTTLFFIDGSCEPTLVTVSGDGVRYTPPTAGKSEFLAISFSSPLSKALDGKTAYLLGNVAKATHGETVANEVLGDGETSKTFQSFSLKKKPVSHIASVADSGGAQNTLSILVDQVAWKGVSNLYGQGAKDHIFTTSLDDDGTMTVQFGDGKTGARLPSGVKNVTAKYRHGLGQAGNLDPDSLSILLDRPIGLKKVTNPVKASGGTDPEDETKARENAPNTVRTFERIVSLKDFEDLARGYTSVAKARATWVWDGEVKTVHLTVAGHKGAQLSVNDIKTLRDYLNLRRDSNRALLIDNFISVAIKVVATIKVDPTHVNRVVEAAARSSIDDYFAFKNRALGQPVHLSDVYAVLQAAQGVISVDVDQLNYKDHVVGAAHGASGDLVQAHILINVARPNISPPPKVYPAELATIQSKTDIHLVVSGGLST